MSCAATHSILLLRDQRQVIVVSTTLHAPRVQDVVCVSPYGGIQVIARTDAWISVPVACSMASGISSTGNEGNAGGRHEKRPLDWVEKSPLHPCRD